jgi:hypothetical protein
MKTIAGRTRLATSLKFSDDHHIIGSCAAGCGKSMSARFPPMIANTTYRQ